MTLENYKEKVRGRFNQSNFVASLNAEFFYEERFEMKWFATKLKQFSFVSDVDCITLETVRNYSENCMNYAIKEYKGIPRGLQNGVVSYSVLISDKVDDDAIDFAMSRPKKHYSAFEMPIIVDLAKQEIFYYRKTPLWGSIYYKHFRECIMNNFAL